MAITLCLSFVSATGIYGSDIGSVKHGVVGTGDELLQQNESAWDRFIGMISSDGGILNTILAGAIIGAVLISIIKGGGTTLLGAFIFTIIFWGSWANLFMISQIGGWIPVGIIAIMSGMVTPLFIGGVVGIFSGSG